MANHVTNRAKKANQFSAKKQINHELREQIIYKKHLENRQKHASNLQELQANNLIENDDTLMAIYPKIKGVSAERKKEQYRNELSKIVSENLARDKEQKTQERRRVLDEQTQQTLAINALIKQDNE